MKSGLKQVIRCCPDGLVHRIYSSIVCYRQLPSTIYVWIHQEVERREQEYCDELEEWQWEQDYRAMVDAAGWVPEFESGW